MKSVLFESENLTQQCSGTAPATSTKAASIRFAISAFCSSVRPSNQWMWTKGMGSSGVWGGRSGARPLGESRLQLGLEAALRHRPDHLLGDRPVLEEDQGRDREHLGLEGGVGHVAELACHWNRSPAVVVCAVNTSESIATLFGSRGERFVPPGTEA